MKIGSEERLHVLSSGPRGGGSVWAQSPRILDTSFPAFWVEKKFHFFPLKSQPQVFHIPGSLVLSVSTKDLCAPNRTDCHFQFYGQCQDSNFQKATRAPPVDVNGSPSKFKYVDELITSDQRFSNVLER